MKKGVWVILERIPSSNRDPRITEPAVWRARLALNTTRYEAPSAKTPEIALELFNAHFAGLYHADPSAYELQTPDDYPDGITEYAVRFIPIAPPKLTVVN